MNDVTTMNTTLSGAKLSKANLSGALLVNTDLSGADLSGATLEDARMNSVLLNGTRLNGANMQNPIIVEILSRNSGAELTDITVDSFIVDLQGAHYDQDTLWPEGFTPPVETVYDAE